MSRDVIGIRDAPGDCLVIAMAHTDSVPPAPGADDNASGVGTLVALARSLATDPAPACDVWLVATGSEERPYTGTPNHLGASALVTRLQRMNRLKDVKLALSLDEVGRGTQVRPALDVGARSARSSASSSTRAPTAGSATPPARATPTTASSPARARPRPSWAWSTSRAATPRATRPTGSSAAPSPAC